MICGICAVGLGQLQNSFNLHNQVDPLTSVSRRLWTGPGDLVARGADGARVFTTKVWRVNQMESENRRLRDEVQGLRLYATKEDILTQQLVESRALLNLNLPGRTKVPCHILSYSNSENRIRIDIGSNQGVKAMQPVITAAGLLGQVATVDSDSADVTLLTSPTLKLTAVVQGRDKVIGLVHGETPTRLALDVQDVDAPLQPGDPVVTSGLTESYPKGLVIGDIIQITNAKEFGVRRAFILPSARLEDASVVEVLE